jgi:hypothetical protein
MFKKGSSKDQIVKFFFNNKSPTTIGLEIRETKSNHHSIHIQIRLSLFLILLVLQNILFANWKLLD